MENNNNAVVNEKKEEKKISPIKIVLTLVAGVIAIVLLSKVYEFGMNVLYSVVYGEDAEFYGATERITFDKEDERNSVTNGKSYFLENFQVDCGDETEAEIYDWLDEIHTGYFEGNYYYFLDYTGSDAVQFLNDDMRYGEKPTMKLEGQIMSIEEGGNVIMLYDMFDDEEAISAYDYGTAFDILQCYVDVSMVENKDQLYVGDYVDIYAYMPGKMPMQDGSYAPCIIAVAADIQ